MPCIRMKRKGRRKGKGKKYKRSKYDVMRAERRKGYVL